MSTPLPTVLNSLGNVTTGQPSWEYHVATSPHLWAWPLDHGRLCVEKDSDAMCSTGRCWTATTILPCGLHPMQPPFQSSVAYYLSYSVLLRQQVSIHDRPWPPAGRFRRVPLPLPPPLGPTSSLRRSPYDWPFGLPSPFLFRCRRGQPLPPLHPLIRSLPAPKPAVTNLL